MGPTIGIRPMSIDQEDLPVSCNRRMETASMGTMSGSMRMPNSGASIARLIAMSTTAALTYSSENHQYSERRARPETVAYLTVRQVRTASPKGIVTSFSRMRAPSGIREPEDELRGLTLAVEVPVGGGDVGCGCGGEAGDH